MDTSVKLGLLLVALCAACTPVMAAGEEEPAEQAEAVTEFSPARAIAIVGACLGAGFCAVGGGFAIARIGSKCIESIARQPEAAGTMFAPMIVSAAMVEGGMLFAIVVCLLGVLGL